MRLKYFFIILTVLFSGCSVPTKHLYGTNGIEPSKLASVNGQDNEVKILSINEKAFKGDKADSVYLKPGIYKFTAMLTWSNLIPVGSVFINTYHTSPFIRTGCLNLEAGKSYTLAASDPTKNWRLQVWKKYKKINLDSCR